MNEVCETVFKFVGIPSHVTFYKKLIIANPEGNLIQFLKEEVDQPIHTFYIKDIIFLKDDNNLIYYRKRIAEGLQNYTRCEKSVDEKGIFSERRR